MSMTGTETDLLEELFHEEPRCQSKHQALTPTGSLIGPEEISDSFCSIIATYSMTATCTGVVVLWCQNRYEDHVKNLSVASIRMLCAHCKRLQSECWAVRPL
jgi:hypothetical protein